MYKYLNGYEGREHVLIDAKPVDEVPEFIIILCSWGFQQRMGRVHRGHVLISQDTPAFIRLDTLA
jgi:hypothetical protein